ncbi:hypothetical protein CAEBREN_14252 [Caenorhabditis brenneri]|uniref:Sdz-33 F-box domain-containing protein n=1 Tax=Caenorhabditis brenneri TaxID=135651 RepID=G0MBJ1_CAEBE|nr:hypothetical protein CAEBREN_14252 [Caenorhabditis brenneri]
MDFPLMLLPSIVQERVVRKMKFQDLIEWSFQYTAFQRMMKSMKVRCHSFEWFFDISKCGIKITFNTPDGEVIHYMYLEKGKKDVIVGGLGEKTLLPEDCEFIRHNSPVGPMCFRYSLFLKDAKQVHPIDVLETYTSVLLDIVRPTFFNLRFARYDVEKLFNLFVWKYTRQFSNVEFLSPNADDKEDIPQAIAFLQNEFLIDNMFIRISDHENTPTYQGPLKIEKMTIDTSSCIPFETILQMECRNFKLRRRIELKNLIELIQVWMNGGLSKLESFVADGFRFNEADFVMEVETTKSEEKPDPETFKHSNWEEKAVDIHRDMDGRKASVFFNGNTFAFIAWPAVENESM